MADMIKSVNAYSGVLTLISVIIAIIMYFTTLSGTVDEIKANQSVMIKAHEREYLMLGSIDNALKDKERDHINFARQLNDANRFIIDSARIMDRLEITLNNIDKKLQ